MKISTVLLAGALAGQAFAAWGFGKSVYNKWHQTELERWLSDHNIPYPTPADRKDLEKLVQDNWQTRVVDSYKQWDAPQLQSYLSQSGREVDQKMKSDKNWLLESVKKGWQETEKTADTAYGSVKNWMFDSWSESQLKAFLDRHGIPNPQPRTRDTYLAAVRDNYETVANKLGETASYPGNWLWETWSDSDLKKWLDERGYKVPQRSTRDQLIAAVRRNSRYASIRVNKAKQSAADARNSVSDSIFDAWSESQLKEFLDKNGVKIPQGSKKNELLALARRNKAYYTGDTVSAQASRAYSSATSAAGGKASSATDTAKYHQQATFDSIIENWSNSRLKAFLDARGVPVPQAGKRDELLAKVRANKHKAVDGWGVWAFDAWSYESLKKWLESRGQKVATDAEIRRDQLHASVTDYYNLVSSSAASVASAASTSGESAAGKATDASANAASQASASAASGASKASSGASKASSGASQAAEHATDAPKQVYASLTSALAQSTDSIKQAAFETWSDSDLKAYLDKYGIKTYQGTARNELIAIARRNAYIFHYGAGDQGLVGRIGATMGYVRDQFLGILGLGQKKVAESKERIQSEL